MKVIYSNIISFRGSHYDFGYTQGLELRESLTMKNRERLWKLRRPKFSIDIKETKQAIEEISPALWEELEGLQDALQQPMDSILRDFGGYRIPTVKSGCSIFTGKDFLVRNYDFHPKTYEGRFTLFQPNDGGYATIGPAQRVTGRMDGMNEKGLAMGYNSIHSKKPGPGFVSWMIGRLILETCADVVEAIQLLKNIPHRHSFSYTVLDPQGRTYIIEATKNRIAVREGNACTNHFDLLTDDNRNYLVDSKRRLENINSQSEQASDVNQAFQLLNDSERGVFSKEYKNWAGTIHTSAYLPKERKVLFALGGDAMPIELDFDAWLRGIEIKQDTIYGEVDTELGFAHMY